MIHIIEELFENQAVRYIFFGCCTTLVNLISFRLLRVCGLPLNGANFISIVLAIVFAYVVNASYVFNADYHSLADHIQPFVTFVSARLITMALEMIGVPLLSSRLTRLPAFKEKKGMAELGAKILTNVVVMILNYIFSRFLVFKN